MAAEGWTRDISPVMWEDGKIYKMTCCDCGLTHDMAFWIEDGNVMFRVRRNNRATGQVRRHMDRTWTAHADRS